MRNQQFLDDPWYVEGCCQFIRGKGTTKALFFDFISTFIKKIKDGKLSSRTSSWQSGRAVYIQIAANAFGARIEREMEEAAKKEAQERWTKGFREIQKQSRT